MKRLILFFTGVLVSIAAWSVTYSVHGVVIDDNGAPVGWASVYLKNTNQGTVSNEQGEFIIDRVANGKYELYVEYLGYQPFHQHIEVNNGDLQLNAVLKKDIKFIAEVSVESDYYAQQIKMQSMVAKKVDKLFITENASGSLMQTLCRIPGVSSIDVGSSVSKPVIRGMSFNRVAVVNNGVKLEGQQWGEMHGLEIDQYTIENVKIIKGPASIMHGSDAIGGVLEILPNIPLSKDSFEGELKLIGKTNNNLLGTSLGVQQRFDKFYYTLRTTYLNYADFKVPTDSIEYNTYNLHLNGQVKNTAGRELGIRSELGYIFDKGKSSFEISNLYRKSGFYADAFGVELRTQLPIDHDASKRDIHIPYQFVNHFRLSNHTEIRFYKVKWSTDIAYQNNQHGDFDQLTDKTGQTREFPDDNLSNGLLLHTITANTLLKGRWNKTDYNFGFQNQYFNNGRSGFNFNIPSYQKVNSGLYAFGHHELFMDVYVDAGIRYDFGFVNVEEYINPRNEGVFDSVLTVARTKDYNSLSGTLGLSAQANPQNHFKVNFGKSFRIPSIRETHANGTIFSSARHEEGNPNLKPEEAWQLDFAYTKEHSVFDIDVAAFYSYFTNYIFANPTGDFPENSGSGQIYRYTETQALRLGGEVALSYQVIKSLTINANTEYLYAQNLANNGPLPFSPPFSFDISGELKLFQKAEKLEHTKFILGTKYIHEQTRVVQNEVPDYYTPSATLIYLSLSSSIHLGSFRPKLMLRVNNLFNTMYYNHLSIYRRFNIPEAGRNIQLTINMPF